MIGRAGFTVVLSAVAALATASSAFALTPIADLGSLGSLGVRINGGWIDDQSSTAFAVGDADGDGKGDLLIGAPNPIGSAAKVYLVLGATSLAGIPDLDNPPAGVTVVTYGGAPGDRAGTIVHLGDVIGDAKDDIIIGAPLADPGGRTDAGSVYVIPGSASPVGDPDLSTLPPGAVRIDGDEPGDQAGLDVYTGDVIGTTRQDLVIGAPFADPGGRSDAGSAFVLAGPVSGVADLGTLPAGSLRFDGGSAGDGFGFEVAAGDVCASTKDDLIVGAPFEGGAQGRVYVIPSDPALVSDTDMSAAPHPAGLISVLYLDPGAQTGRAIALGDWSGDAKLELAFGAPGFDSGADVDVGAAAVASFAGGVSFLATYTGESSGDAFGWDLGFGDVTGTPYDELLIGAPSASPGGRALAGRAYLLPSGTATYSGSPPAGVFTYDGIEADDALGSTVIAGDLNGDQRDDAILGAERADVPDKPNVGSAFVIFGDDQPPTGVTLSGAPDPVYLGETVTWTATGSDPEGGPVQFAFDVDQSPGFEVPFGASASTMRAYLSTGVKTGTVRVRDAGGATTDASDTVEVVAAAPGFTCTGAPVFGTNAADSYSGGYGNQTYAGLGGADTISGGYDNDCLLGNGGNDTIEAGYGNDFLYGGSGADVLKGGYGDDVIDARDGSGGDTVSCGANNDRAYVDPGDSTSGCETVSG